jgi:hypothetical protein
MYLGMGTYNELFLPWIALVFLSLNTFVRLALELRDESQSVPPRRRYLSVFLIVNGLLMAALRLQLILGPLLQGRLYPAGLSHFTTMIVQGFDLALFLPPSIMAGWAYGKGRKQGLVLAPVYAVFLSLQREPCCRRSSAWASQTWLSALCCQSYRVCSQEPWVPLSSPSKLIGKTP